MDRPNLQHFLGNSVKKFFLVLPLFVLISLIQAAPAHAGWSVNVGWGGRRHHDHIAFAFPGHITIIPFTIQLFWMIMVSSHLWEQLFTGSRSVPIP